jgi:NADH dehydrogenase
MVREPSTYSAPAGLDVLRGDVTDPITLIPAVEGIDTVVHCVAITGDIKEPYRGAYQRVHQVGTENLMAAASASGVGRVVAMSGLGTVPAKAGTYMATRWGMEEAVRRSGIPYAIIQPSIQFGRGAEFIVRLAQLVQRSPVVPMLGDGTLRFQPIWVEDVVTCVERSLTEDHLLGQEHTIGGSEYATIREILQVIAAVLGKRRLLLPLPLPLARLQARLMTAILPRPPLTPAALELFSYENATDIDAVDRIFGFHPRGFREHVRQHGLDG